MFDEVIGTLAKISSRADSFSFRFIFIVLARHMLVYPVEHDVVNVDKFLAADLGGYRTFGNKVINTLPFVEIFPGYLIAPP